MTVDPIKHTDVWRLAQQCVLEASKILEVNGLEDPVALYYYQQLITLAVAKLKALLLDKGALSSLVEAQTRYSLSHTLYHHTAEVRDAELHARRALSLLDMSKGGRELWTLKGQVRILHTRILERLGRFREAELVARALASEADGLSERSWSIMARVERARHHVLPDPESVFTIYDAPSPTERDRHEQAIHAIVKAIHVLGKVDGPDTLPPDLLVDLPEIIAHMEGEEERGIRGWDVRLRVAARILLLFTIPFGQDGLLARSLEDIRLDLRIWRDTTSLGSSIEIGDAADGMNIEWLSYDQACALILTLSARCFHADPTNGNTLTLLSNSIQAQEEMVQGSRKDSPSLSTVSERETWLCEMFWVTRIHMVDSYIRTGQWPRAFNIIQELQRALPTHWNPSAIVDAIQYRTLLTERIEMGSCPEETWEARMTALAHSKHRATAWAVRTTLAAHRISIASPITKEFPSEDWSQLGKVIPSSSQDATSTLLLSFLPGDTLRKRGLLLKALTLARDAGDTQIQALVMYALASHLAPIHPAKALPMAISSYLLWRGSRCLLGAYFTGLLLEALYKRLYTPDMAHAQAQENAKWRHHILAQVTLPSA